MAMGLILPTTPLLCMFYLHDYGSSVISDSPVVAPVGCPCMAMKLVLPMTHLWHLMLYLQNVGYCDSSVVAPVGVLAWL